MFNKITLLVSLFFVMLTANAQTAPTSFVVTSPTTTSMILGWTAPSTAPTGYFVLRTTSSGTSYPNTKPVSRTIYKVGNTLGNATVVYVGANNSAAISSLSASSQFSYSIYSYNSSSSPTYSSTALQGQAFTIATNNFASQPSSFTVVTYATPGSLYPIWTVPSIINNGLSVGMLIIYAPNGITPSFTSTNGSSPLVGTGNFLLNVTNAYAGNATINGLSTCLAYNFLLVPYTWDGTNAGTYNYYTTGALTASQTTFSTPIFSGITAAVTSSTTATLGASISVCGTTISTRGIAWNTVSGSESNYYTSSTNGYGSDGGTTSGTYSVPFTGYSPQSQYYFKGYVISNYGPSYSNESNFYTWSNPPTAQPGSFSTITCATQLIVNWTTATFPSSGATMGGYLVIYSPTGSTPSLSSSNGSAPTAGVGTIVNITPTKLPTNPATTTTIIGMPVGVYKLLLIPYTWDGVHVATYNYLTASAITTTGTVGLQPPTFGSFTVATPKTYGASPFTLLAPTSNSSGTFSYTSSNTSVATISGNTVTIVGAGTTILTANQAAFGLYSVGSITATLTVNKATFSLTASAQNKTYANTLALGGTAFTTSGLIGNDSISSVTLINSNTTTSNSPTTDPVGSYSIVPSAAVFSTGSSNNYLIIYLTGKLTVNVGVIGTWVGITSTNFSTASNWQSYSVPTSTKNVIIPAGTPYSPVLTVSDTVANLSIASGQTLGFNGQSLTINGFLSGNGLLSASSNSNLTLGGNLGILNFIPTVTTIHNLTLNSNATATLGSALNIAAGSSPGTVSIATGAVLNTGGNLTLLSDSIGTARVDQVTGIINGYITVQRYIGAKAARKWSFVGSSVSQSFRNAWQQQIYITGIGNGGTPCGNTLGDSGPTDRFNSKGFDATQTNTASVFIYNATQINGSRFVSIDNTEQTNLTPGIGYRVNIRGNRNSLAVTCTDQLQTSNPAPPEAVTLSATGIIVTGVNLVKLYDTTLSKYTLIANPYPSQISFTSFQATNSSKIYNKAWTYSPFGIGNYTTYSAGVIINGAIGYDNISGDRIASGQAFFVQASPAGSASTIAFQESHKVSGALPNTQYFGTNNFKLLRVGLRTTTNDLLDEVVVRYNTFGTKSDYNPDWDAESFSEGNKLLQIVKINKLFAIITLPESQSFDTANLEIISDSVGTFNLSFTDYQGLDNSKTITLLDNFLGTSLDVRANPMYTFKVTNDSLSQGRNRFDIVFGGISSLPVSFTNITTTKNNQGVAINWSVANEANIASYAVERSINGSNFTGVELIKANWTNNYLVEDEKIPTVNTLYYRIKAISKSGNAVYSNVVKLLINNSSITTFSLFPNPMNGTTLNLKLTNVNASKYVVSLFNLLGEKVFEKVITHSGGSAINTLRFNSNLAVGIYNVVIRNKLSKQLVYKSKLSVIPNR